MPIEATGESRSDKIRVILVEDHVVMRMILKKVLGLTPEIEIVAQTDNGHEAIELVEKHRPDVVLMDVGLPLMDGIEAAGAIRKLFPDVKIVMLTAHDNDREVFAALAAGASGYCLKNMEPERLYRAIRSVNAGELWLDSAIASKMVKFYSSFPGLDTRQSSNSQPPPGADGDAVVGEKAQSNDCVDPLSPREMEVLSLLVGGFSNQQIADHLVISLATVKTHVRSILNKLAVDDRTQAAVHAMRRGLV